MTKAELKAEQKVLKSAVRSIEKQLETNWSLRMVDALVETRKDLYRIEDQLKAI